jgi:hypothetical protein
VSVCVYVSVCVRGSVFVEQYDAWFFVCRTRRLLRKTRNRCLCDDSIAKIIFPAPGWGAAREQLYSEKNFFSRDYTNE